MKTSVALRGSPGRPSLVPSTFRDAEFLEPCGDLGAVGAGVDLFQYVEDRAVGIDDEGPPLGISPPLVDHAIALGDLLVLVAQYRIVEAEGLGETTVGSGRVTTRRKEGDVVLVEAGPGGGRKVYLIPTFELDDK